MEHSESPLPITVSDLSFRYYPSGRPALKNFSLEIPTGRCAALLGPTGSGKTTFLQILSGIAGSLTTAESTGAVQIGKETFDPIPSRVLFPAVGFFMQDPFVQLSGIHDTVEEEIAFTLHNLGIPFEEQSSRIAEMAGRMKLDHLMHRHPARISGGELQRVLLASLLVSRPSVLLLDEPADSLDPAARHFLAATLRSLRNKATVLIADAHVEFALQVADLFVVIDNGTSMFTGTRASFFNHFEDFRNLLPVDSWIDLAPSRSDPVTRPLKMLRTP